MWAENNNNNNNNNKDGSDFNRQRQGATFYFTLPVVVDMSELRMGEEKEVRVINDQRQL
jgi:hypothetical protein